MVLSTLLPEWSTQKKRDNHFENAQSLQVRTILCASPGGFQLHLWTNCKLSTEMIRKVTT